ncbi:hypothetical protein F9U64_22415 [Gracilibacillus oryzae]|uniref:DNA alkylation repair protein n=1 Tax=Gracilibacillus oryzae TaxID=1672701 RepID=A0A7C8GQ54_9BACI|nr:DNA alkylation repair protein [Gracilibacillus oryzae]KAB8125571.1 hypothetical protein F9U64_22415 [Gracilibacillus oryzae]
MAEYVPLKYYFDEQLAVRLSTLIKPHYPLFPQDAFIREVANKVINKELKQRVEIITDLLKDNLPENYIDTLNILLHCLGPENSKEEGMFKEGYFLMPVAFFVEKYGINHMDASLKALYEITKRHTSEYAIRPYLNENMELCILYLEKWINDENSHVRRLVSEGTRPRLPWAKKMEPIKNDPANNLQLLEKLINDPSKYVQKSVANHINDLTKDYPEEVLTWLEKNVIYKNSYQPKIVIHGLRTLLKNKDDQATKLVEIMRGKV